jgi:hypothetical protein
VLLNIINFKAADTDFERNPLTRKISDGSVPDDHAQTRSVYDYNPEIEQDDWNVFNTLFLLISIIIILLMLVFINYCSMLCDLEEELETSV